jgi:aquaporin Z
VRSALCAEFVGTFFLVFAGTGAIVVDATTHALTHVGVSTVFGLVVMVLVYALGHVSGAHFNPAVTTGFWAAGEFPAGKVPAYVAAQIAGAVAASASLRLVFGTAAGLGATVPATGIVPSLVLEALMTMLLMLVILGSAVDGRAIRGFAGLAIGGTIGLDALFGGPISGASMNPARSFGPALVAGVWRDQWVYWAAPVAGALLAVAAFRLLRPEVPAHNRGFRRGAAAPGGGDEAG